MQIICTSNAEANTPIPISEVLKSYQVLKRPFDSSNNRKLPWLQLRLWSQPFIGSSQNPTNTPYHNPPPLPPSPFETQTSETQTSDWPYKNINTSTPELENRPGKSSHPQHHHHAVMTGEEKGADKGDGGRDFGARLQGLCTAAGWRACLVEKTWKDVVHAVQLNRKRGSMGCRRYRCSFVALVASHRTANPFFQRTLLTQYNQRSCISNR